MHSNPRPIHPSIPRLHPQPHTPLSTPPTHTNTSLQGAQVEAWYCDFVRNLAYQGGGAAVRDPGSQLDLHFCNLWENSADGGWQAGRLLCQACFLSFSVNGWPHLPQGRVWQLKGMRAARGLLSYLHCNTNSSALAAVRVQATAARCTSPPELYPPRTAPSPATRGCTAAQSPSTPPPPSPRVGSARHSVRRAAQLVGMLPEMP
jgi:hypothetical protein